MKVLHTNFHRGWGGQSNRILNVCIGLTQRGRDVTLAVPRGSELAGRAREAGVEVDDEYEFARGFRPRSFLHDARRLRALILDRGFDIVHTHGSQDSWVAAWATRGVSPRPIVLRTRHNVFAIKDHIFNRLLYGRWTDGLVCISSAIVEQCAAKPYLRRENLEMIHSAVDADAFAGADGASLRTRLELDGRFVAGVTGRLRDEKGHQYLIEALPRIIAEAPDFVLLVVGDGSLRSDLEQRVHRLGVTDHVCFTGFRKDIPRVLAMLDLFVMPSVSEGLGTGVIEAACAGLPIVASDVGGIPDVITNGKTGLLVPPRDPDALASAVLELYRDRERAREFGRRAAEFARAEFTIENLVAKTEAVYQKWIDRRRIRAH